MDRALPKVYALFLALSVLILAGACSKGPVPPFPAIDFSVEDLFTGDEIHLAELKGRPVLIYFFASW